MNPDTDTGSDLSPRFIGTGSEYFGIWIVNLLLVIVTVGLYYPWARARRMKYFASNTDIDGYPLEFTAQGRRMFGGFVLALVLFILYSVADEIDPVLGWVAFALGVLVWPWLTRAALRFRLAHLRWRGMAMRFTGTLGELYRALLWPLALAALLLVSSLLPESDTVGTSLNVTVAGDVDLSLIDLARWGIVAALVALVPFMHHRISRYQHDHFAWGGLDSRFTASSRQFYALYWRCSLIIGAIVCVGAGGAALALWLDGGGSGIGEPGELQQRPWLFALVAAAVVFAPLAIQIITAYFTRGSFNLRWSHTQADGLRIAARLSFWRWLGLRLLNLVLTLLTLGLYKPFAEVALMRMQLAALTARSDVDAAQFVTTAQATSPSAASDAAADLFDVEIGL